MKHLSRDTNGKWAEADETNSEEMGAIEDTLKRMLLCENLVILCGLGTSLCVKDGTGTQVASTMRDLWDKVKTKYGDDFEKIVNNVNYEKPGNDNSIELLLSQCQLHQALKPAQEIEAFIALAEKTIVDACNYDTSKLSLTSHESFLRKVARRSARQPRMKLFTTNYDSCFESAANNARFTVVDGFSHCLPQEFDGTYFSFDLVRRSNTGENPDFIPNVFHLYKLHGSVDWERQGSKIIKKTNPARALIIYPRSTKFESSYEQPFLELMANFQLALRSQNTALLIIGCGLNDKHIYEPILSSVRSNISLNVAVISPGLESSKNTIINDIKTLIEKGDSRLWLLDATFEEVVKWIPDLVAETETEQHENRMRMLNK